MATYTSSDANVNQEPTLLSKFKAWDKLFESDAPPRLGLHVRERVHYTAVAAFLSGITIGVPHGAKKAAYLFRAENAHRIPNSPSGWFQYHKWKNYAIGSRGLAEGLKLGSGLAVGAVAFSLFEETVDYARNDRRDFLSTVTAGLSFSGIYSLLKRHDIFTAARTAKLGLKLSLTYGLLQDALETFKGNPPAYVEFITGKRRSKE
ncbi:uncharacterized protein BDW47DRAFT_39145 [Aspergillus candidus]|uniref:Uncharacterized protein n=1 Tax=Aspergillus candidus TaxID=41067 RepID=A0A2I2F9J1_ASPCN|nr:hypothetical protein BDW47DRAFT_39145 [Aspergillus candidus]PLB37300.1 hypothetical protein BDW47DRAFT_39145 [Aspergillus candidus]